MDLERIDFVNACFRCSFVRFWNSNGTKCVEQHLSFICSTSNEDWLHLAFLQIRCTNWPVYAYFAESLIPHYLSPYFHVASCKNYSRSLQTFWRNYFEFNSHFFSSIPFILYGLSQSHYYMPKLVDVLYSFGDHGNYYWRLSSVMRPWSELLLVGFVKKCWKLRSFYSVFASAPRFLHNSSPQILSW